MELIYIYIDRYRTFSKQEISFSDKFYVKYDDEKHKLSISENKNYINIYPNHITNINGVFGKNGSGKTSLLSLIGKKIEERDIDNEIFVASPSNPHKKLEICSANKLRSDRMQHSSSYFLLYYDEKPQENVLKFIFETDDLDKYEDIFSAEKIEEKPELKCRYSKAKGWFPVVFQLQDGNNIACCSDLDNNLKKEISIIQFQHEVYKNNADIVNANNKEDIIALERRIVSQQNFYLKSQIKFLIEQMQLSKDKKMYADESYTISIEFSNDMYDKSDIVKDYRDFDDIDKTSEVQKIILAFLDYITRYLVATSSVDNKTYYDKKNIDTNLRNASECDVYNDLKNIYYEQIAETFVEDKVVRDSILLELREKINTLEEFLNNEETYKIKKDYTFHKLSIKISKESNVNAVCAFFDKFIDQTTSRILERKEYILDFRDCFKTSISYLSDGEQERLALFASIHEQINYYKEEQKFILLFDEIERSMHPDLCRCLISDLIDFLKQYSDKEFQIIIASHSPFIASDLLEKNIVCLQRQSENQNDCIKIEIAKNRSFAQNIYTLLRSQFFLEGFLGKYAERCIQLILKCLDSTEPDEIIKEVNQFLGGTVEYNSKQRIHSIKEARYFVEYIIQQIGEPVLRDELSNRLSNKMWGTIDDQIQYYRELIKELESKK